MGPDMRSHGVAWSLAMGMGASGGLNLELSVPSILMLQGPSLGPWAVPPQGSQVPEFSLKPLSCHFSLFSQVQT